LGSIRKAAIKTLNKLFKFRAVIDSLKAIKEFDENVLIQGLIETKFDTQDKAEEEVMLLLVVKMLKNILKKFQLKEAVQFNIV
jgi:hypothetical protein